MNIDKFILKEQQKRAAPDVLDTLLEMIEGILDQQLVLEAPRRYKKSTTGRSHVDVRLSFIPDIAVSEIGWSDVSTREGEEVSGPQRQRLENYLKTIAPGGSLKDKIAELQSFYASGYESVTDKNADRSQLIQKLLAYLVFYKTLTKVITDFNAASAGFNFESFLSVLVGGTQIQTGMGTIADLVDANKVPISLKLYAEKTLSVEGSFRDLVNDLVSPLSGHAHPEGGMRYVVCAKTITGKKFDQTGTIKFYQFDITLDNVVELLNATTQRSKDLIRLPNVIGNVAANFNLEDHGLETSETLSSVEEMYDIFKDRLGKLMAGDKLEELGKRGFQLQDRPGGRNLDKAIGEEILDALNWPENETIFKPVAYEGDEAGSKEDKIVVRGRSKLVSKDIRDLLEDLGEEFEESLQSWGTIRELDAAIRAANIALLATFKATAQKINAPKTLKGMLDPDGEGLGTAKIKFLSSDESVKEYAKLRDPEMKKMALRNSLGYLGGAHTQFHINRAQAQDPSPPINSEDLGTITIGAEVVVSLLNDVKDILNDQVWEIFAALQSLSDNLNSYFAGGLTQDSQAEAAVDDSEHIGTQTTQLTQMDQGEYSPTAHPGAGGVKRQPGGRMKQRENITREDIIE